MNVEKFRDWAMKNRCQTERVFRNGKEVTGQEAETIRREVDRIQAEFERMACSVARGMSQIHDGMRKLFGR